MIVMDDLKTGVLAQEKGRARVGKRWAPKEMDLLNTSKMLGLGQENLLPSPAFGTGNRSSLSQLNRADLFQKN